MELILKKMISTSLRAPETEREQGENLVIEISVHTPVNESELSQKFSEIMSELDHHHLSADSQLRFGSYGDLISWLDKRLKEEGVSPQKLAIQVNSRFSLSLI